MLRRPLYIVLVSLAMTACDQWGGAGANPPGGSAAPSASTFNNPVEEQCARTADQFANLLVKGDYHAAYGLCSSHLRVTMTADQLAVAEQKSIATFGRPTKYEPIEYVNTDAEDLAGPNHEVPGEEQLDAAIRKMGAHRAVGDMPDSIPVGIRRASIVVDVLRDPKTIPNFEQDTGTKIEELEEDDMPRSYLTIVLVEEDGQMRVGHYWHRWPDMLD